MTYGLVLSERAIEDLDDLHIWITGEAGASIADGYLDRIEARIAALSEFPNRGTSRHDLAPGLRTLSFERSLVIAYRVDAGTVLVLRVISAQRELSPLLG